MLVCLGVLLLGSTSASVGIAHGPRGHATNLEVASSDAVSSNEGFTPLGLYADDGTTYITGTVPCGKQRCSALDRVASDATDAIALPLPAPLRREGTSLQPHIVSQKMAYVLAGHSIWVTTDAGQTWSEAVSTSGTILAATASTSFVYLISAKCSTTLCRELRLSSVHLASSRQHPTVMSIPGTFAASVDPNQPGQLSFFVSQNGLIGINSQMGTRIVIQSPSGPADVTGSKGLRNRACRPLRATHLVLWYECTTGMQTQVLRSYDRGAQFFSTLLNTIFSTIGFALSVTTDGTLMYYSGRTPWIYELNANGSRLRRKGSLPGPGQVLGIGFQNPQHGFLLQRCGTSIALFSTDDGGASWKTISL